MSCLLCRTTVYRVASEVPVDFELRDGLVAHPGEDVAEGEVLRGRDGFIEINLGSEGCIVSSHTAHKDIIEYNCAGC